jgi:hypothetical protein
MFDVRLRNGISGIIQVFDGRNGAHYDLAFQCIGDGEEDDGSAFCVISGERSTSGVRVQR